MSWRDYNLLDMTVRGGIDLKDAHKFQAIARSLRRLDLLAETGLTDRQKQQLVSLEKQAQELARLYHLVAYHQTDTRGWSLYLLEPDQDAERPRLSEGIGVYPL